MAAKRFKAPQSAASSLSEQAMELPQDDH